MPLCHLDIATNQLDYIQLDSHTSIYIFNQNVARYMSNCIPNHILIYLSLAMHRSLASSFDRSSTDICSAVQFIHRTHAIPGVLVLFCFAQRIVWTCTFEEIVSPPYRRVWQTFQRGQCLSRHLVQQKH